MTLLRLFRRDCAYHRNRLLALGAAAALIAAILTGALLIGDSVRGTLHDRVNRNAALLTDRLLFPFPVPTALTGGVLHAEGLLRNEELKMKNEKWRPTSSDTEADRHGRNDGAEATVDTKPPYDPTTALPHHRTTVLPHHLSIHLYSLASLDLPGRDALASPALARRLNLKPGDRLSVQLATRPVIASESLMGRPPKLKQLQLLFRGVCTNAYAELSFGNPQEEALNLFVPHTLLAETLDLPPGAVNEIWQRDPVEPDDETLWALSQLVLETWNGSPILTSRAFFLPRHLRDHFPEATAGLFSFAQVLSNATDRLDYFFIGAFERGPYAVERDTAALSASLPGNFTDGTTLTLYRTTGYRNITTLSHRFPAIRRIDDSAFPDPLKPAIPGLTDVDDCSLWEAGIPVDFDRVTKADEAYWDRYRSKPKLYLNFDQALVLSGFDTCTLLLFPKGYDPARLRREILAALRAGPALYRRETVAETLRAKIDNGVAFAPLFLGLSLFLILSALLVLAMLLRLHWQDRAGELRLLQTYLPDTPRVRRFLTLEILAFLIPGALAGLVAGCALCALQLYLLEHVWNGIVHLERFTFHARASSFLTAFLATVLTGWVITRCSFHAATERTAPVRLNAPLQTLRQLAARLFLRKLPEHRFCLILLLLGFLGTLGVGGFGIKARGEDGFGRMYVAETALAVIPAHDAPFPEGLFPVRVHEADRADCANLLQAALPTVYGCDLHALTGEMGYLPSGCAAVDAGSLQWIIKKKRGDRLDYPEGPLRIERSLKASVFQKGILVGEESFHARFPEDQGARFFLIRDAAALPACTAYLEPYGARIRSVDAFMAEAEVFQNRYLAIFLQLGILGFLLGLGAFILLMIRNRHAAEAAFLLFETLGFSRRDAEGVLRRENQILYLSAALAALILLLLLAAFAPIHLPTVLLGWFLLTAAGLLAIILLAIK